MERAEKASGKRGRGGGKGSNAADNSLQDLARSLVTQQTRVLSLVIPQAIAYTFTDPYFPTLIQSIMLKAAEYDYAVMLWIGNTDEGHDRFCERVIRNSLFDGLLVAEVSRPSHGVGYEIAAARYRFGIPVICLWRPAFTKRCSGMIAGDEGVRVLEYTDETVGEMLTRLLASLA